MNRTVFLSERQRIIDRITELLHGDPQGNRPKIKALRTSLVQLNEGWRKSPGYEPEPKGQEWYRYDYDGH